MLYLETALDDQICHQEMQMNQQRQHPFEGIVHLIIVSIEHIQKQTHEANCQHQRAIKIEQLVPPGLDTGDLPDLANSIRDHELSEIGGCEVDDNTNAA